MPGFSQHPFQSLFGNGERHKIHGPLLWFVFLSSLLFTDQFIEKLVIGMLKGIRPDLLFCPCLQLCVRIFTQLLTQCFLLLQELAIFGRIHVFRSVGRNKQSCSQGE
ncbi:hypothetical protein BvCmsKSP054_02314 [Escherichia coli]|nr:hypothetical protein BvCmsKSP054_02314 [Escherichia coli]